VRTSSGAVRRDWALGAAALYALGGVYTARRFTGASPVELTIGQQLGAFVLRLPFALAAPPRV
jgi:drug/metabolite transporter (DMT)-like permease